LYYFTDAYCVLYDFSHVCINTCINSHNYVIYSDGINHFVLFHDANTGLMSYTSKGRPTKEQAYNRLHCPEKLLDEINSLRKDLSVKQNTRILLLVSLATDDMVRLVSMHPEVWFIDCTGSTNRQKKDLFMLAIRNTLGKTFPGNLTIIPSGKRWVFHCIYRHAFLALNGKIACSRNRLALTDEDDSEMSPFENLIATTTIFSKSVLMLCIFHAVWQPFKEKIFPLLPKKNKRSNELSDVGEDWGKNSFMVHYS